MTDAQGNQQDLVQKARRLSAQIARIKSGLPIHRPGRAPSLREQIEERMNRLRPRRSITVSKPDATKRGSS
jgi:hypothetical protein